MPACGRICICPFYTSLSPFLSLGPPGAFLSACSLYAQGDLPPQLSHPLASQTCAVGSRSITFIGPRIHALSLGSRSSDGRLFVPLRPRLPRRSAFSSVVASRSCLVTPSSILQSFSCLRGTNCARMAGRSLRATWGKTCRITSIPNSRSKRQSS